MREREVKIKSFGKQPQGKRKILIVGSFAALNHQQNQKEAPRPS